MTHNEYPTSARELIGGPHEGTDNSFLLGTPITDEKNRPTSVHIGEFFPLAVNDGNVRDTRYQETGILLPTRKEVSQFGTNIPKELAESKISWKNMYTVSTFIALAVTSPEMSTSHFYLLQNSPTKPVNKNRWNIPSGFLSSTFSNQTFIELNEETALLIPSKDGEKLVGINLKIPKEVGVIESALEQSIFVENREDQMVYIRKQLEDRHSEHARKEIEWTVMQTQMHNSHLIGERPNLSFLEQGQEIEGYLTVDESIHSANFCVPLSIDLGDLDNVSDLDLSGIIAVDPEWFDRNHALLTLEEAKKRDTIYTPQKYFYGLEL